MATKNGRQMTREDLNDSIGKLGELVDSKLDRVLDRVESVRKTLVDHIDAESKERDDANAVRNKILGDVESLKKFKWKLVGAVSVITVVVQLLHFVKW